MKTRVIQLVAVLCVLLGVSAFAQDKTIPETRQELNLSFSPVVKKTSPAVVNIYTKRTVTQRINPFMSDPLFQRFFGDMAPQGLSREHIQSSLGSGVIVEADGLIVTNSHVVKDAEEIVVVLNDGREFDAKVSLVDERSDLAILRVDAKGADLPYVSLKPSDQLEVGDIVIAIGNPFGVGQTVTSGIVSALARSSLNINDFNFFIQTDAAINPGNSGGPLVSMDGGVVGINTAIYSRDGGSLGIGFAVPSEMVATVIAAEKSGNHSNKAIPRSWMGISGQKVTADIADSLGLNRPAGVLVNKLHPASPLLDAGLKVGDVITEIDGKTIRDPAELKFRMATIPLGQVAGISIIRKGENKTLKVKTIAPPDKPARDETELKGSHILNGVKVSNINPAVGVELKLTDDIEGVVVTGISPNYRIGRILRPGDIIFAIGDEEIKSVTQLKKALEKAAGQGIFALTIDREGKKTQIVIR